MMQVWSEVIVQVVSERYVGTVLWRKGGVERVDDVSSEDCTLV